MPDRPSRGPASSQSSHPYGPGPEGEPVLLSRDVWPDPLEVWSAPTGQPAAQRSVAADSSVGANSTGPGARATGSTGTGSTGTGSTWTGSTGTGSTGAGSPTTGSTPTRRELRQAERRAAELLATGRNAQLPGAPAAQHPSGDQHPSGPQYASGQQDASSPEPIDTELTGEVGVPVTGRGYVGRSRNRRRGSRRDSPRRGPLHLPQVAAAGLGVLVVLGLVLVVFDRMPGDSSAQTSAITSVSDQTPTPTDDVEVTSSATATKSTSTSTSTSGSGLVDSTVVDKASTSAKKAAAAAKSAASEASTKATEKATGTTTTASGGSGAEDSVAFGVFRGTSTSEVSEFGDWVGRDVDYAADFSTRTSWDEIANPTYMLQTWQGSGYRMVYATAMLPTQDSSATLAAGADGDYDEYYKTLAENLVAYGQGDAIIRLGWEFNLTASRWHPDTKANFIGYWRHIVTAMRSVAGTEGLEFDFNPNIGGETYDSTKYYPGDAYVDYVGVDTYDISWAAGAYPYPSSCNAACKLKRQKVAWDDKLNGTFGLKFWANFAKSHGKPFTLPEWGLWDRPDGYGGADNAYFIEQMYRFIDDPANNVGYQIYFEYNPGDSGTHMLTTLTSGGAKFRALFGN